MCPEMTPAPTKGKTLVSETNGKQCFRTMPLKSLTVCFWLCFTGLFLLDAQPARPLSIRRYNLKSEPYLYLSDVARYYGMNYSLSGKDARLQSRYSLISFSQDKRIFKLNGVEANLSFAVTKLQNELLLAQSDFQAFIDPILRNTTIPRRRLRHIMLDPGHGGSDPGAQHQGVSEKNVNLALSRRTAAILRKRGYRVSLTREQDVLMSLEQRAAQARKMQPDLFLSIHCNAFNNPAIQGIETYIINPANTPSSGGNVFAKNAAPGNSFDRENALLGYLLQKRLLEATQAQDRGIKRKQFYVIREVPCPAALIELGFLSNADERKRLLESYYQDKLAVAICDVMDEYERILKP